MRNSARGGGPSEELQKPYQTVFGIISRLKLPRGTVADQCARQRSWPCLELSSRATRVPLLPSRPG
eukprot:7099355-Pyramimonas_sp.AAC.1